MGSEMTSTESVNATERPAAVNAGFDDQTTRTAPATKWGLDRRTFLKATTLLALTGGSLGGLAAAPVAAQTIAPWNQQAKLAAADGTAYDYFSYSVSITGDGDTALVGAAVDNSFTGSAYVFTRERETFPEPITLPNGQVADPQDLDGDGLYEDLDGDGDVGGHDVSLFTRLENAYRRGQIQLTAAQIAALDFNGDGKFTRADVAAFNRAR